VLEHGEAGRIDSLIPRRRFGPPFAASVVVHGAIVGFALLALRHVATDDEDRSPQRVPLPAGIVWLQQTGTGVAAGGGGNRTPGLPRNAEAPGRDRLTVRVVRTTAFEPAPTPAVPDPIASLNIPVQRLSSGLESLPGAIQGAPGPATLSQGPGSDGDAGDGTGGGDGSRHGRGLRDGRVYGLGDGVAPPIALYRGTPVYTVEAMRARIEGTVVVACVVQTNGECTDISVVRSLDRMLGPDAEAVKAAARWRFRPGTREGKPVPVFVTIEIAFSIR
jgi:protein TonB